MEAVYMFGDVSSFGIQCRYSPEREKYKLANCHLFIGNSLIGRQEEECYLPTWYYALRSNRDRIEKDKNSLFPAEFRHLSDRGIFEIIAKANQLEEEFLADFLYLPRLSDKVWANHSFHLDETIDQYRIFFYVKDSQLTFLIEVNTERADSKSAGSLLTHTIPLEQFFATVDAASDFLLKRFPYLRT